MMISLSLALAGGQRPRGAAAYASSRAPAGYRWQFVTYSGARVTKDGEPVVALVEAA